MAEQSVWQTFQTLHGGTYYGYLGIGAILLILLLCSKEYKKCVGLATALAMIFCFNEMAHHVIIKFGGSDTYYRFFWMLPTSAVIGLAIGMLADRVANLLKKPIAKMIVPVVFGMLLMAIVIHFGTGFIHRADYKKPANDYKVSQDVIDIAEMIHEDEEKMHAEGLFPEEQTQVRVMANEPIMLELRQYDPSLLMPVTRDAYIGQVTPSEKDQILLTVVQDLQRVNYPDFQKAVKTKDVHYVVAYCNDSIDAFLKECEYTRIGTVGLYMVFRVAR